MDDVKLDELLREAGADPRVEVELLQRLARETRGGRARSRRGKPLAVAVTAVAGVVLLAAGAGTAALLRVPPFQTLEPDMYRTQASIPVDYRSVTGREDHCLAFLEFTNLTVSQAEQADALVRRHDWSGIGQSAYDEAAAGRTSADATAIDLRLVDALGQRLQSITLAGMPGIARSTLEADGKPAWNGYSFSCSGGQR